MTKATINDMIAREIQCCVSGLVHTLAHGYTGGAFTGARGFKSACQPLEELCEQALELAAPVPDYEEAAIQAGYKIETIGAGDWQATDVDGVVRGGFNSARAAAYEAASMGDLDPYDREVYEHWAVSPWLAEQLIAQGEKVDTDFAGLNVWARTTTGQMISADGVIQRIYDSMMEPA